MRLLALLGAGALATGMIAAAPASAQHYGHDGYHHGYGRHGGYGYGGGYRHGYHGRGYGYGHGWRGGYRYHRYGCGVHRGYYAARRCY